MVLITLLAHQKPNTPAKCGYGVANGYWTTDKHLFNAESLGTLQDVSAIGRKNYLVPPSTNKKFATTQIH